VILLKKLISLVILTILVFSIITPAFAVTDTKISIKVNGKAVSFPDAKPYIASDGTLMLPVNFVAVALGAKVTLLSSKQTVEVKAGNKTVTFKQNDKTIYINGKVSKINTATSVKNGRTFVPLYFFFDGVRLHSRLVQRQ
jgi:hypothetical protein